MKQIFFFAVIIFCFTNAYSQHNDTSRGKWNFELSAGIRNPAIRGDLTANSIPGYINISLNDKIKNPDFGIYAGFEARRNKMSLTAQFNFLNLEGEGTFVNSPYSYSRSRVKMIFITAGVVYEFYKNESLLFEMFGGARLNYIRNDIETFFVQGGSRKENQNRGFTDPVTGVRFLYKPFKNGIPNKFFLKGYLDIGGFGIVSMLSSRSSLSAGFEFNRNFSLCLGYDYLDVNFRSGNYIYDAGIQGFDLTASAKF